MPVAPVVVPRELTAQESHPIVAKAKTTLARKFKPTRSAAVDNPAFAVMSERDLRAGVGQAATDPRARVARVISFTATASWPETAPPRATRSASA
jgi:hypothetical protein